MVSGIAAALFPLFWHGELVPDLPFQGDVQHAVARVHRSARTDDIDMELLMLSSCFLYPSAFDALDHCSNIPWYPYLGAADQQPKCLYEDSVASSTSWNLFHGGARSRGGTRSQGNWSRVGGSTVRDMSLLFNTGSF